MKNKNYTTFEISKICGVSMPTIIDWIDSGKLKAFKTLGGHRRVKKDDLVSFLKQNNIPLPEDFGVSLIKKILIVDDDPAIIKFVIKILQKYPDEYETAEARDGFHAGQVVSDFKPDIVVLDIFLPGINGFDVCGNIKLKNSETKIIAITGQNTEDVRKKIMDAGADIFLPKPFDSKSLLESIKQVINK